MSSSSINSSPGDMASLGFHYNDAVVPEFVAQGEWSKMSHSQRMAVGPMQQAMHQHFSNSKPSMPTNRRPLFSTTGGGLGVGKSEYQKFLVSGHFDPILGHDPRRKEAVFIDPDEGILYNTKQHKDLPPLSSPDRINKAVRLYSGPDSIRSATIIVASSMQGKAVQERKSIVFGSTMTTPAAGSLLQTYAKQGYEKEFHIVGAPAEFIEKSMQNRREKGKYHGTNEDFHAKSLMAAERTPDWLQHGGENVVLVWNEDLARKPRIAAILKPSSLTVVDRDAYRSHTEDHDRRCADLQEDSAHSKTVKTWSECLRINPAWKNAPDSGYDRLAP